MKPAPKQKKTTYFHPLISTLFFEGTNDYKSNSTFFDVFSFSDDLGKIKYSIKVLIISNQFHLLGPAKVNEIKKMIKI